MTTIEIVLFDFGGVFTPSPFEAARVLGAERGLDGERILRLCFGPYEQDTDHPWHRLERGEIAFEEARRALTALAAREGIELDPFDVLASIRDDPSIREAQLDRVRELRGLGLRTGILTNNVHEFREAWHKLIPDGLFEVIVDSSAVGMRKPDPRVFHHTIELFGGPSADRIVFLDDHVANVAAARSVGMHAILVGAERLAAMDALDVLIEEFRGRAG